MIANRDGGDDLKPAEWAASTRAMRHADLPHDALEPALERSTDWLLARQHDDGYWVGELEGDTILESEYILLLAFLGLETDPVCVRMRRYIQDHQLADGGWAIYPGGPTDVSASVKAYFALKLVGIDPGRSGDGARARGDPRSPAVRSECNSFTRFYLALLGQIGYDDCPCVPPELVLIPSRLGFSLSAMSAWTRTIVVPLSIMSLLQAGAPA